MRYWNRRKKYQLIYMLADLISSVLIWCAFLVFRWMVYDGKIFSVDTILIPMFDFYKPLLLYPIGCLVVYYLSGFYLRPLRKRYIRELRRTLVSALMISFGAFFIIVIDDPSGGHYERYWISFIILLSIQFVGSYLLRALVIFLARKYDNDLPRRYTICTMDEVEEFEKAHSLLA